MNGQKIRKQINDITADLHPKQKADISKVIFGLYRQLDQQPPRIYVPTHVPSISQEDTIRQLRKQVERQTKKIDELQRVVDLPMMRRRDCFDGINKEHLRSGLLQLFGIADKSLNEGEQTYAILVCLFLLVSIDAVRDYDPTDMGEKMLADYQSFAEAFSSPDGAGGVLTRLIGIYLNEWIIERQTEVAL